MEKAMSKILRVLLTLGVGGAVVAAGGCQKNPPVVAKVSPEEARPGATVISPSDKPAAPAARAGEAETRAKSRGAGSPPAAETSRRSKSESDDRVATDRSVQNASEPLKLSVVHDIITVPAGTSLKVRTTDSLSSDRNRVGDTFRLTLDQPLIVDGRTVADAGSEVVGRVTDVKESGRVKGRAELGFTLMEMKLASGRRAYPIVTDAFHTEAQSTKKRDALTIGGGAGVGALIGAIAGGKKGAVIGAGVGGAAGTGAVLATRGKEVEIPPKARFTFRLSQPVEVEVAGDRSEVSAR